MLRRILLTLPYFVLLVCSPGFACSPPTTAPNRSITICSPLANATVASPVAIAAAVKSSYPVSGMRVYVDGVSGQSYSGTSLPASLPMTAGAHRITIKAWDSLGVIAQSITIAVTDSNPASCVPPEGAANRTVTVCTPATGSTVTSPARLTAAAKSNYPVTAMKVYVDGTSTASVTTSAIDTSLNLTPGTHSVTVKAWDSAGSFSSNIKVSVLGDTPPPNGSCVPPATAPNLSVTVCSPSDGAQVVSEVLVSAAAKSTNAITAMRIYVDGIATYLFHDKQIETTIVLKAGTHRLTIKAWDSAGNVMSKSLSVTASSGGEEPPPPPPPLTGLTPKQFVATPGQQVKFIPASPVTSWSVDGVVGGDATTGTIAADGTYTAPAAVGTHQITATAASETFAALVYVSGVKAVVTQKYDNFRTGSNDAEIALTPANVNQNTFGKLFSYSIDGNANATPLYMSGVDIPGVGLRNVLLIATEHNKVYAFDADGLTKTPYWTTDLGVWVPAAETPSDCCIGDSGVTGTPVLDAATGTMYVVSFNKENAKYIHKLHALDIRTGTHRVGSPVAITATYPGTGDQTNGAGMLVFNNLYQMQRPALLLSSGRIYIGWASYNDYRPYHGWMLAYDASTLQQVGLWVTTPNGWGGGIWHSSGGPAADANGNVYIGIGNGTYSVPKGGIDYSQSIVKLDRDLKLLDYFTPYDWDTLNRYDRDVGAGGVLLVEKPPAGGASLAANLNKGAMLYVLTTPELGKYRPDGNSQIFQSLAGVFGMVRCTPAYWNGFLFAGAKDQEMKKLQLTPTGFQFVAKTVGTYPYPGTSPVVSANGTTNGVVWALRHSGGPALLTAYNANDLSVLWTSAQAGTRDTGPISIRFNIPLVVNGRVYVGGKGSVTTYGLLPQ